MGQAPAKPRAVATRADIEKGRKLLAQKLTRNSIGRSIQRDVQREMAQSGMKDPSRIERALFAPGRNQAEIRRIIKRGQGDVAKEINFTLRNMPTMSLGGEQVPNFAKIIRQTNRQLYLKDWYGKDVLNNAKKLKTELEGIFDLKNK